jgi:hypothetical protein
VKRSHRLRKYSSKQVPSSAHVQHTVVATKQHASTARKCVAVEVTLVFYDFAASSQLAQPAIYTAYRKICSNILPALAPSRTLVQAPLYSHSEAAKPCTAATTGLCATAAAWTAPAHNQRSWRNTQDLAQKSSHRPYCTFCCKPV